MARSSGKKDDLVKCEYCGEMYSTTYKHCPFCNEDGTGAWDEPEEDYEDRPIRPAGGKRLAGGGAAGGGYYDPPQRGNNDRGRRNISPWSVLGVILSLVLIIAAICIVVSIFRSITGRGPKPKPTPTPPTVESTEPTPTPSAPVESEEPTPTPTVEVTVPPAPDAPTDFRLNATDLTFDAPGQTYNMRVIFTPEGSDAEVTWTSSDPEVASVSWNGRVTAISRGTVNITATIEGLGSKSCIFRCNFSGTAPSAGNGEVTSSAGGMTLSRSDFTLDPGESWQLTVSGTSSTITWSSSNESVATVSSNGTVTNVGRGQCTVTAEVDGVKLSCIVRCKGN